MLTDSKQATTQIDLTQAEGLNDLINAETENQFKISMSQFEGVLSEKVNSWRTNIVFLLSKLEALIDFSDEDLPFGLERLFAENIIDLLTENATYYGNGLLQI